MEGYSQVNEHICLTAVRQLLKTRETVSVMLSLVAHAGHIDSRGGCSNRCFSYTVLDNTRQGYARESTLKPAGYLFPGV